MSLGLATWLNIFRTTTKYRKHLNTLRKLNCTRGENMMITLWCSVDSLSGVSYASYLWHGDYVWIVVWDLRRVTIAIFICNFEAIDGVHRQDFFFFLIISSSHLTLWLFGTPWTLVGLGERLMLMLLKQCKTPLLWFFSCEMTFLASQIYRECKDKVVLYFTRKHYAAFLNQMVSITHTHLASAVIIRSLPWYESSCFIVFAGGKAQVNFSHFGLLPDDSLRLYSFPLSHCLT